MQDIRANAETAIDSGSAHDGGETSDQHDRNGTDEILQQQRVPLRMFSAHTAHNARNQGDRKIVPKAGDAIAYPGGCALAAGPGAANRFGDLPAALQDDDDDKEMHDRITRRSNAA